MRLRGYQGEEEAETGRGGEKTQGKGESGKKRGGGGRENPALILWQTIIIVIREVLRYLRVKLLMTVDEKRCSVKFPMIIRFILNN